MALTKKARQARTAATASAVRTRVGKSLKRSGKSNGAAMEALSEQEAMMRIEEHLKRTGYKTPKVLERIWEQSKKNGTDKMTLREINAVIKEARKELKQKQK
jgi:hypothetical protein